MNDKPVVVTDESFEPVVLASDIPVVVDFWAAWCGPCRLLSPILDDLATEFAGRLQIAKLNIDDYPRTATRYGIQALPTLIVFVNGRAVHQITGVESKRTLTERFNTLLETYGLPSQHVA